jgi:oxygen-dependent protoporphyrinogen oxidase
VGANGTLDAVVIGGGIAGLAAAWELRDRDIVLLEADERLGGRILSERRGDVWLNFGAHVFGGPGSASDRLLTDAGVTAVSVPGRLAAVALNGKILSSGAVETFPFRLPLSPASRIALVRAGIRLRLAVRRYAEIATPRPGEDPSDRQLRMLRFMDDRSFTDFSGVLPEDVDLLFRSTLTRSSGEPEELAAGYGVGYFHLVWNRSAGLSRNILGGSNTFIEGLAGGLGDRIRLGARVTAVRRDGDGVRFAWIENGVEHEARAAAAIVATPAFVTRDIVADLPVDTAVALDAIPYGPYVVGAFLTSERSAMPWDDLYALATPKRSFSMLFNTANVLRTPGRPRQPNGSLMVYAAAGFARRLAGLDDAAVADRFRADLTELYPEARGIIEEVVIKRWERGLPYPRVGRSQLQAALTRSLGPVHLAGDYLGTWYTETAIQTAVAAAAAVRRG